MSVTSYDDVPYESDPVHDTHPANLAALAMLRGLEPPPVDRCRVLELGCGTGGNLIPMALGLPGSEFIGIDLSQIQINDGERVVRALGLDNITLQARSILDLTDDLGTLDYVICHGVYSWVPPAVQDAILALCARHLAPTGVAFISYNTYPGWHLRGMVREMMLYHARRFREPAERVRQARAFLQFLVDSARRAAGRFDGFLREELALLQSAPDYYLFHEHLEEVNRPLYFHEFVDRVQGAGLQYLAEAAPSAIRPGEFGPEVEETLRTIAPDAIALEQYLDFLRNRTFRETLVCRAGLDLTETMVPEAVFGLHLTTTASAVSERPDLTSDAVEQFRLPRGITLSVSHPWVKTGLQCLADAYPVRLPFDDLVARVAARLSEPPATQVANRRGFAEVLVSCWVTGFVELLAHPGRLGPPGTERPLASPLARLQAERGRRLTSLAHGVVEVPDLAQRVLLLLDGSRDRPALAEALAREIERDGSVLTHDGTPAPGPVGTPDGLAGAVEQSLLLLGRAGLLMA